MRVVLKMDLGKTLLCLSGMLMIFATPVALGQENASPQNLWQTAAGGKREFVVATIRQSGADVGSGNVDLDASDYFRYTGGVITATGYLVNYIIFAYKIDDTSQYPLLNAQLPKWAQAERFHIEARAETNPSKDQIRLMIQSLLADRFKLAIRMEKRELPAYALVLDKDGKTGPQLKPHPEDGLCTKMPDASVPTAKTSQPAPYCGVMFTRNNGQLRMRMMDFSMPQIAGNLASTGATMGGLDPRTVIDQTGLEGKFDLEIEFLREPSGSRASADSELGGPGPSFVEALKNQAGLRLVKRTAPVDVFVVDHVERPSAN
jgi:uncharacterized protein (TIGR03435 family)